jgi:class 3 adenylate cyclase
MLRRKCGAERQFTAFLRERARIESGASPDAARRIRDLDGQIRRRFERTVAPFVLDMAGFTRLTLARGILHCLTMICRMRDLCGPVIARRRGAVVRIEADNLFAHFPRVRDAVDAAADVQEVLAAANVGTADDSDVHVGIGIGWGPTLVFERDMWGLEFNLASKLGEDLAGAGEVFLTTAARRAVEDEPYRFRRVRLAVAGRPHTAWLLRLQARPATGPT